jgi:hypothetical protein
MIPLYSYREWSVPTPDFEHPPTRRIDADDTVATTICPIPSCMAATSAAGLAGPAFIRNCDRWNYRNTIVVPCEEHAGFQLTRGWHRRLLLSVEKEEEVSRPDQDQPWICVDCDNPYSQYLWDWPGPQCPECAYQRIRCRESIAGSPMEPDAEVSVICTACDRDHTVITDQNSLPTAWGGYDMSTELLSMGGPTIGEDPYRAQETPTGFQVTIFRPDGRTDIFRTSWPDGRPLDCEVCQRIRDIDEQFIIDVWTSQNP